MEDTYIAHRVHQALPLFPPPAPTSCDPQHREWRDEAWHCTGAPDKALCLLSESTRDKHGEVAEAVDGDGFGWG